MVSANDSSPPSPTSFPGCCLNVATPTAPAVSMTCLRRMMGPSTAQKMSKTIAIHCCSIECERKDSAEKFPKNFALIRLAEKTFKKMNLQPAKPEPLRIVKKASVEQPKVEPKIDESMCPLH